MTTLSPARSSTAGAAKAGSLAELRSIAHESAVFYIDAVDAAGTDTVLGELFARLARSKQGLAVAMARSAPAAAGSGAGSGPASAATIRQIRNELRARRNAAAELYAERMKLVERSQLEAVLEFLDRDIPMPVKNAARPYLRAAFRHQDLIDHAMAHGGHGQAKAST